MPMTEFPRFAMDDSGACSGKRACDLANCGAYPSAFGRKQGWQSWPASRSIAHPKIMERGRVGETLSRFMRNGTRTSKSVRQTGIPACFVHIAIQQAESPLGAQASMLVFRPLR